MVRHTPMTVHPDIVVYLQWLTKAGEETDLKEAIDAKSRILAALDKYKKLNIASGEMGKMS